MDHSTAVREVTSCPACGGTHHVAVGEPAPAFETMVAGRVFWHPSYVVLSCPDCGLYFKSHSISAAELSDYYSQLEAETFDVEGEFPTDIALRGALDRLPAGRRILDFGCSTGRLLRSQVRRHECFGVEPNEEAAAIARTHGIRIVTEGWLKSDEGRGFDVIMLTDVYEHMLMPLELLGTLVNALKRNGILAIISGNADAISTRYRMAEFWYFRIHGHLQMMSERHVHWLADRLGIPVEELHRCSHYDASLAQRARQHAQSFAYHRFRREPGGLVSAVLRRAPFFRRAERWTSAPALDCTQDHFVAVFRKH